AAVTGVDLGGRLQIKLAFQLAGLGAEDAFGHGALEAQWAADGKNGIADIQGVRTAQRDIFKLGCVFILDMQQGEVMEFIDGDDADLLESLAVKLAVDLAVNFHGNLSFAFDDVKIGDEVAVGVNKESRAQAFRGADLHDSLAELFDKVLDI